MHPTVRGEWWHHQPRASTDWFDAPALAAIGVKEEKKEPVIDWVALIKYHLAITESIKRKPMRRKECSDRVKVMQRKLASLGFDVGVPNERFGWRERYRVKQFQRVNRLTRDGIVGPRTWDEMWGDEPLS